MYIQQLYTSCLAEAAYYIESNGEAAIIDPLRETSPYLELAASRGATIKYIFETHFHADFVSGHIDLAQQTGAKIVYGPTAQANYDILVAEDEQDFPLGNISIRVLHTPGHTMESSCFLVLDETGKEQAVFTGDTLFIGDVGRPDLAVKSDLSREDLARFLYRSINEKLIPLDDMTTVYPAHGAGSQCGKNLSKELFSTIGNQKKFNYALQLKDEDSFVQAIIEGLTAPPQYFPKNAQINKEGYQPIDTILTKATTPLNVEDFKNKMKDDRVIVIDSRSVSDFSKGFIPKALNIGLQGFFAVWVGTLIEDLNTPFLLVTEKGQEKETALRLARVGYENVLGYLDGGFEAWEAANEPLAKVANSCPVALRGDLSDKLMLDVRTETEYQAGYIGDAKNLPLATLMQNLDALDKNKIYHVYCKSGYRSMIATSILMRAGFKHVINIKKGYEGVINPSKTCCCPAAMNSIK